MAVNVLVVTHDVPFGEFIRQSLEETGNFSIRVTKEAKKAVSFLLETDCTLAFIDSGRDGQDMLAIGRRLRETRPGLRFIVLAEAGWHSALEELSPEDYLTKPFYLPDLLETMGKMYPDEPSLGNPASQETSNSETPPWLSDVSRAAQHLTRLTLESSAQAALITSSSKLWAYAGQLPQAAARELADTVTRYWDKAEENDLVRFVRLNSTDAEHMLYATRLATGMVLALVFDAETPFSTIHSQASQLVHSLSNSPAEAVEAIDGGEEDVPMASLSNILSDVPPPNPSLNVETASRQSQPTGAPDHVLPDMETTRKLFSVFEPSQGEEAGRESQPIRVNPPSLSPHFSRESSPAMPRNLIATDDEQVETRPYVPVQAEEELAVTIKSKAAKKTETDLTQVDLGETLRSTSEGARTIVLEPVSASVYNLDYACLLVPRFTQHILTGDLSNSLGEWVQQICIAFGWRLEYISVRPEYLQWIANVPPVTSPGYLMRIMRQHTSERIFTEFSRFSKENPSGDFWAPGYLIMGGSQPPPGKLIKDFIAQTRQRQGIPQPIRR